MRGCLCSFGPRGAAAEGLGSALLSATAIGSGLTVERLAGGNDAAALRGDTLAMAARLLALIATLRELEATLNDTALSMFRSLVACANLRARKRLEATIAASADGGRERLVRIAAVLEALAKAAKGGGDILAAVTAVAPLATIEADAALIRRTTKAGRADVLGELGPEYRVFKQIGGRFLASFTFEGRASTSPLREAVAILAALGGDWRKPLPEHPPLGHIERRWYRHVVDSTKVDRSYWELATYFALADALAAGDVWVPSSRLHRSLEALHVPAAVATTRPPVLITNPMVSADL